MAEKKGLQPPEPVVVPPKSGDTAMLGGPGLEPPAGETPPAAPQLVEITINGRKFQVDPEFAQAYDQRQRDFDRTLNEKLSDRDRRIAELQQQVPPPKPREEAKGYSTILFENPDEAVKRIKDEMRQELTQAYLQEKQQERFWGKFWATNKDLDPIEDDIMVKGILQAHLAELAPMSERDAADKLADLTRRQILRYSQKTKAEGNDNGNNRAVVESAAATAEGARIVEPQGPNTLSDVIRQRRAARRSRTAA